MTPTEFGKMFASLMHLFFWMFFLGMSMFTRVIQDWSGDEVISPRKLAKMESQIWEFLHTEKDEAMKEEKALKF